MSKLILSKGCSKYGAQMGRPNILPSDTQVPIKLQMQRLRWVSGDYDQWGAYWGGGSGDYVYCAFAYHDLAMNVFVFVRAENREQAKLEVREILPNASFHR